MLRQIGTLALAAFAGICLAGPAAHAATPPNLTGQWIVSSDIAAKWDLQVSADRKTLTAHWNGSGAHATLVGRATGTLNQNGTAYTGPMHVDEGSVSAGGTMTFSITSQLPRDGGFGLPLLNVTYSQDNGVSGSLSLEIWLLPLRVAPTTTPAVNFGVTCPSEQPCDGDAAYGGVSTGGAIKIGAGTGARAARRSKTVKVGSVHFSIRPHRTATIKLPLNKAGRRLLAKRGSLRVPVFVSFKKSSGLRPRTKLGTVTFRRKP